MIFPFPKSHPILSFPRKEGRDFLRHQASWADFRSPIYLGLYRAVVLSPVLRLPPSGIYSIFNRQSTIVSCPSEAVVHRLSICLPTSDLSFQAPQLYALSPENNLD